MLTRRGMLKSVGSAALAAWALPRMARAQAAPAEIPGADMQDPLADTLIKARMGIRRVAGNIYVLFGAGGNIGFLDGPDGTIVIDSGMPDRAKDVSAAIAAVSKKKPSTLINTHYHFDHVGGNEAVHAMGYTIVAHTNTRKHLSERITNTFLNMTFEPAPEPARPAVTFDDSLTLYANGETLQLQHVPPAHTDTDIFIRFDKAGVIQTGDLFFNGFYPFIDTQVGGSLEGMIAAEEKLHGEIDDKVKLIPGHGPMGSRADLKAEIDMLKKVRDLIKPLVDAGKSIDEVAAAKPLSVIDEKFGKGFLSTEQFTKLAYLAIKR